MLPKFTTTFTVLHSCVKTFNDGNVVTYTPAEGTLILFRCQNELYNITHLTIDTNEELLSLFSGNDNDIIHDTFFPDIGDLASNLVSIPNPF